jgi:protein phosphatase 1 regulatory subunit 10
MSNVAPSSIYHPPVSGFQNLSPQARQEKLQLAIRPMLQATSFTGAQAVHNLVTLINEYGSQDVDAATRLEILTKIRDQAGNHYFRAWSENVTAIDISREWLKSAFMAKVDDALVETIMPLLHVSDI